MVSVVDRSAQGDDRRRAELIEVASRIFMRAPTGGLTLAAVAQEAGVSKRLMYHYFADIQALYTEMFDARIAVHTREVDAELAHAASATPEERLAMAIRRLFALPASYRRWTLLALTDALPAELASRREQVFESLVRRWGALPIFAPLDLPTKRTVMAMVVSNVCMLATAIDEGHLTVEQATSIAVASILGITHATREAISADR
ncbi:MAG: TetR/AcrR family transcriptional regulator [Ilumatobacteraceae bacterium]